MVGVLIHYNRVNDCSTRSESNLWLIGSGYKESSKFTVVVDQPVNVAKIIELN